jgi:hypothetical protein
MQENLQRWGLYKGLLMSPFLPNTKKLAMIATQGVHLFFRKLVARAVTLNAQTLASLRLSRSKIAPQSARRLTLAVSYTKHDATLSAKLTVSTCASGDELTGEEMAAAISRARGEPFVYKALPADATKAMGPDAHSMRVYFDEVGLAHAGYQSGVTHRTRFRSDITSISRPLRK